MSVSRRSGAVHGLHVEDALVLGAIGGMLDRVLGQFFFYHGVHLVDRPYRGRALEDRVRVGPPARVPELRACGLLRLAQEPPP